MPVHSWDIDHEMYFGSRLLAGNLMWTQEFHDKLPFVAVLCVVPAYFKSVYIFKLLSIFSMLLFSVFLVVLYKKTVTEKYAGNEKLLLSSLVFISLLCISHDSIATINCIAVSFYGIALLLVLYDNFSNQPRTIVNRLAVVFFGSCFGAMAVSIRPYYIAALGMALLASVMLRDCAGSGKEPLLNIRKSLNLVVWAGFIGVWGCVLNILPYALTGQLPAFHDGLTMLGAHINPLPAVHDFLNNMWKIPDVFLWGAWIFMVVSMFSLKKKDKTIIAAHEYKIFWISNASALAMLVYMLSEHYWPHYMQLFIANFSLSLVSYLSLVKNTGTIRVRFGRSRTLQAQGLFRVFLAAFSMLLLLGIVRDIVVTNRVRYHDVQSWSSTEYNWKEELFRDYLTEHYPNARPSFLFPDDMKAHWLLDEPRYGFPHAANTKHIFLGWWENITFRSSHFFIMSNGKQYCEKIRSNGPEMIVIQPDSFLLPCMSSAVSGYKLETTLEKPIGKIMVFRRAVQP